jgi:adenine-specific DNA-methyltransferase
MNIDGKSLDITQDNLAKLKQLFPNLVKEGQLDLNELKATFGQEPTLAEERYGLSWAGKYEAFKQVQEQTSHTLIPDRATSIEFDQTENIFIEGENLTVLKILQKSYYGQVKMIYIDPPYNTGNDHFIYPDKYAERKDDYLQRTGTTDDWGYLNKADLFRKNSRENGQFHSVWLSMMYPRLYLARNLLCEGGIIFVSIDDNEVANLKLLMDEVFGEENFVVNFVWKSRQNKDNRNVTGASIDHEYILCYGKRVRGSQRKIEQYSNPDDDSRGPWASGNMVGLATIEKRPNLHYDLINPETGINYGKPQLGWRYDKKTMERLIREDRILWPDSPDGRPRKKTFLSELKDDYTGFSSVIGEEIYTKSGTSEIDFLFDFRLFDFPKPSDLIKELILQGTDPNSGNFVLDFFAGSGTTAHAVLELNNEDGGNRKFICVQWPEETPTDSEARKAGYATIADIGRARIRKVIEQLNGKSSAQVPLQLQPAPGFRAFTLASSNFKIWQGDVKLEGELLTQLDMFQQPVHSENEEAMLWELLLKAGYPLSATIETRQVGGAALHVVNSEEIIIALQAVNLTVIEAVRQAKPTAFICLDKLFNDDDQLKTNISLQFQEDGITFRAI